MNRNYLSSEYLVVINIYFNVYLLFDMEENILVKLKRKYQILKMLIYMHRVLQ